MTIPTQQRALFLLLSATICIFAGCSKTASQKAVENERKNIIKSELENTRPANLAAFDVQSVELLTFDSQPVYLLKKSFTEPTKIALDYSQIETLYDGYGNKTESRCLENDPLLRCVILKTSANGQKQAYIYGKNGEVKNLPDEMIDKAMTAATSNLAAVAGIFEQPKIEMMKLEPPVAPVVQSYVEKASMSLPLPTPEIIAAADEPKEPKTAEKESAEKLDTKSETKLETKPLENKEEKPEKIKIDTLWLNNSHHKIAPQTQTPE